MSFLLADSQEAHGIMYHDTRELYVCVSQFVLPSHKDTRIHSLEI